MVSDTLLQTDNLRTQRNNCVGNIDLEEDYAVFSLLVWNTTYEMISFSNLPLFLMDYEDHIFSTVFDYTENFSTIYYGVLGTILTMMTMYDDVQGIEVVFHTNNHNYTVLSYQHQSGDFTDFNVRYTYNHLFDIIN